MAIIEQVENEINSGTRETDEPASTANTNNGNTEADANDGAAGSPAEDKDEISTRTEDNLHGSLRLASAALHVFGIRLSMYKIHTESGLNPGQLILGERCEGRWEKRERGRMTICEH